MDTVPKRLPHEKPVHYPIPAYLKEMITKKRRLRKKWQETRCPTMKAELNRLGEKVKAELQKYRDSKTWETHIVAYFGDAE